MSEKDLPFRNKHIGFVLLFHHLLPNSPPRKCMLAAFIAQTAKKDAKRASELITFLGLKDRLTNKPNELSGGEKQRVAVPGFINKPSGYFCGRTHRNLDSQNHRNGHLFLVPRRIQKNSHNCYPRPQLCQNDDVI
jgi:lipoprotein-releasing system ATP-binding protein